MRIPATPDELTAEWLTKALRETGAIDQGSVTELDITPLDQGGMGLLVRLQLAYSTDEGGPGSLIAKFSHPNPGMRTGWKGAYEREIRFYQDVANNLKLRTPHCYYADSDPESGEHVLLLEDLPSTPSGDLMSGCSAETARAAVVGVAKLHAPFWETSPLGEMDWLRRGMSEARLHSTQERYQRCWDPFLEKVGHKLPDGLLEIGEALRGNVVFLGKYLFNETPQTLIHGDYRVDNVLFGVDPDGGRGDSFAVLDWQLVGRGCGIVDVQSFLCTGLQPAARLANEMDTLCAYHMALVEDGVGSYSFDECLRDYRYATLGPLQRIVWYIGAGRFKDEETQYLLSDIMLPRITAAVLDLDVGELLPM